MQAISVKEARSHLSDLIKRVKKGEEILILRRGQKVARLTTVSLHSRRLPDLGSFRANIRVKGKALSRMITARRREERF